ncbi:MAG: hypothetical protein A2W03_16235 [Candidatus Aminicenantes bacterium RBG_16_63_16]|nr:MAG: hypothetical protein A2W03_16235 [Candidatus Aminicenantes bacterium RBG_16_63_16]
MIKRALKTAAGPVSVLTAMLLGAACESRTARNPGDNTPPSTPTSVSVFLDITDRVVSNPGVGEMGLLGLAFDPGYAASGAFYVNYTTGDAGPPRTRATRVSRFRVSPADRNRADPASETVLLEFPQPFDNHNGGQLAFGPDGYLYIATGDGGSGGDPLDNAQNLTSLLGKILRIDVRAAEVPYGIPPDNPFAGNTSGYRAEIYAYGLRNPWRFSFDPPTGRLWAGDVGQSDWEEIDLIVKGGNFGWDCREGAHPYTGPAGGPAAFCAGASGLIDPVWEYGHSAGNISVTGGYVYRGLTAASLRGAYLYGDFGTGRVWALTYDGVNPASNALVVDAPFLISSFGLDRDGEFYIMQWAAAGGIHRIDQTQLSAGVYSYSLTRVFDIYSPAYGTDLQHAGDGTNRLFAAELPGVIRVLTPGT